MNLDLAYETLKEITLLGVDEFVVCPGARNVPWLQVLVNDPNVKVWWGFEERSAAFFALGRIRNQSKPVAVLTTSGTAVGELLPACMEAFYTSAPLILMTADRPRHYRYTGAPQTCIQPGILGPYAPDAFDIHFREPFSLNSWKQRSPLHINVSFEEPERFKQRTPLLPKSAFKKGVKPSCFQAASFFLEKSKRLLTIVSTLNEAAQDPVSRFLEGIGGDVYIEAVSGLKDRFESVEPNLSLYTDVLRIGGIPTHRCWRDLEDKPGINVLSLSENPFPGLTQAHLNRKHCLVDLESIPILSFKKEKIGDTVKPEPGILHDLSLKIEPYSHIYLGNSLPIRMWDQMAVHKDKNFRITASRGLNGIDGQLSTFLGLCRPDRDNWAILGDLTTLYDLSAPWFIKQMEKMPITIAVLNNGGGKIFDKMFPIPEMVNAHTLNFEPFAKMWGLDYEKWKAIPETIVNKQRRVVEIV